MTLDELSVSFTADISGFTAAVGQAGALISAAAGQADALAGSFSAAGASAGDGLAGGILSRRGAVVSAARAVAVAAANALRGALDIHSPSRLTYETGVYFDEGLLRGIAASADRVEKEAQTLGLSAAQALADPALRQPLPAAPFAESQSAAPVSADGALNLTIPLEIDGYRLGVAAIEGINRVTGGTGRVTLNL